MGTKLESYRACQWYAENGQPDAAFVANLIMTRHSASARKLKGLVRLLRSSHSVRTAQFDCDTLIVDGNVMAWSNLDYIA